MHESAVICAVRTLARLEIPLVIAAQKFDVGGWLVCTLLGGVVGGFLGLIVWVIKKASGAGSSTSYYRPRRKVRKRKLQQPNAQDRWTDDEGEDDEPQPSSSAKKRPPVDEDEALTTSPRPPVAASRRDSKRLVRESDDNVKLAGSGAGGERALWGIAGCLVLAVSMVVLIGIGCVVVIVLLSKSSSGPSGGAQTVTQSSMPKASSSSSPLVVSPSLSPPPNPPDQTVKLPGTVTATAVGAEGRLLILLVPDARQLAVFDVEKASVVKLIPVPSANVKIAAGRDKLMIVQPETGTVQRWSLTTFEKETAAQIAMKVPPIAAAMGSASDGPLVICGVDFPRLGETAFVDVQSMKRIAVADDPHRIFDSSPTVFLRASANGHLFTCEDAAMSGRLQCLAWNNGVIKMSRGGGGNLPVPGPDGSDVYTTRGRFGSDLKAAGGVEAHCLPACRGGYFLAIAQDLGEVSIYRNGSDRPVRRVTRLDEIVDVDNRKGMPLDMRVFCFADAKLLITVSSSNDSLLLRKVDAAGN
jgi:hypothetical protein